jgi:hypothetical protein
MQAKKLRRKQKLETHAHDIDMDTLRTEQLKAMKHNEKQQKIDEVIGNLQNSDKLTSKADVTRGLRYVNIAQENASVQGQNLNMFCDAMSNGEIDSAGRLLRGCCISVKSSDGFNDDHNISNQMNQIKRRRGRRRIKSHNQVNSTTKCVSCRDVLSHDVHHHHHEEYASCVNGHMFHGSCFAASIALLQSCPECNEPLICPKVKLAKDQNDDCCCSGGGNSNEGVEEDEDDGFDEFEVLKEINSKQTSSDIKLLDARSCLKCGSGPILQTNCLDLKTHHGQCPKCKYKMKDIDSHIKNKIHEENCSIYNAIPTCKNCEGSPKLMFNGCYQCGIRIDNWNALPMANTYSRMTTETEKEEAILKAKDLKFLSKNIISLQKQLINESIELSNDERLVSCYIRHVI